MATFCKIDAEGKVKEIHSVSDSDCLDENGNEAEAVGIAFLSKVFGHTDWKQCSYNTGLRIKSDGGLESYHKDGGTPFRGTYPAKGYFYHEAGDFFHRPQPFNSWTLDTTEKGWKAPVTYPSVRTYPKTQFDSEKNAEVEDQIPYFIGWDEDNQRWLGTDKEEPANNFIWNPSTSSWDPA